MDMNFILNAMAEGKTADDLAKEFTDALNAANAEIARRKAEEAKSLAKTARLERLADIVKDITTYALDYYADKLPTDAVKELTDATDESYLKTAEEVDELIEEIILHLPMLIKLVELQDKVDNKNTWGFFNAPAPVKRPHKPTIKTLTEEEAEGIISQFLGNLL